MSRKIKARVTVSTSNQPIDHTAILTEEQAANTSGALMASLEQTGVRLPDAVLAAIHRMLTESPAEPKEFHISLFFSPYRDEKAVRAVVKDVRR